MQERGQRDVRKHPRRHLNEGGRIMYSGTEHHDCAVVDLSEGGAALYMSAPLRDGTRCVIAFDVDAYNRKKRINVWGEVVYTRGAGVAQGFRVGVRFTDMDPYSALLIRTFSANKPISL
ncbi:PilZ domain-containing protein [Noviherbaspirillum autotrophicum]|uniref:PilZ domain-containing protein n=1 Tax=Noviherbaspirillum autotrophicum TaxID=709839 RepID=UPI000A05E7B5|nr:PilZ domain-containing protein [Noviherbaspirillum autotrophicum]